MSPLAAAATLSLSFLALLAVLGRAPYRDELRSPARQVIGLLLWFLVLTLVVFLPVTGLQDGVDLDPETLWFPGLFLGHAAIAVFLFGWWKLRADVPLAGFLWVSARSLGEKIARGVLIGVAGWGLTVTITGVAVGGLSDSAAATAAEVPKVMIWMATLPLPEKLGIILAAMTVEEAFFRAFLQPRIGLALSSLLFALSHFSYGLPFLVIGVFCISLVLGVTFERAKDLTPCIVAHGVFDAVQLLIVLPWAVGNLAG
jgi:membrane protease YdiL (CAAX protease family)